MSCLNLQRKDVDTTCTVAILFTYKTSYYDLCVSTVTEKWDHLFIKTYYFHIMESFTPTRLQGVVTCIAFRGSLLGKVLEIFRLVLRSGPDLNFVHSQTNFLIIKTLLIVFLKVINDLTWFYTCSCRLDLYFWMFAQKVGNVKISIVLCNWRIYYFLGNSREP